MGGEKVVFAKSQEDVGFADPAVADNQNLCQVIVGHVSSHFDFNNRIIAHRKAILHPTALQSDINDFNHSIGSYLADILENGSFCGRPAAAVRGACGLTARPFLAESYHAYLADGLKVRSILYFFFMGFEHVGSKFFDFREFFEVVFTPKPTSAFSAEVGVMLDLFLDNFAGFLDEFLPIAQIFLDKLLFITLVIDKFVDMIVIDIFPAAAPIEAL